MDALGHVNAPAERRFDAITEVAKECFGVEIVLVTLIDQNRQWFKSAEGIAGSETDRDISFCAHAILSKEIFQIQDAREDERFRDNPLVTGPPYIRFYAGIPVHSLDGLPLGTLCLIDPKPRKLSPLERMRLRSMAGWLEAELQAPREATLPFDPEEKDPDTGKSRWLDADTKCWNEAAGQHLLSGLLQDAAQARTCLELGVIQLRGTDACWAELQEDGVLADARMGLANILRKSMADRAILFTEAPGLFFYMPRKSGRIGSVIRLPLLIQLMANLFAILGTSARLHLVRGQISCTHPTGADAAGMVRQLKHAVGDAPDGESVELEYAAGSQ